MPTHAEREYLLLQQNNAMVPVHAAIFPIRKARVVELLRILTLHQCNGLKQAVQIFSENGIAK